MIFRRLHKKYSELFALQEWSECSGVRNLLVVLYIHLGAFLVYTERAYVGSSLPEKVNKLVCPPYFQNCGQWNQLLTLPDGWGYELWVTFLFTTYFLSLVFLS